MKKNLITLFVLILLFSINIAYIEYFGSKDTPVEKRVTLLIPQTMRIAELNSKAVPYIFIFLDNKITVEPGNYIIVYYFEDSTAKSGPLNIMYNFEQTKTYYLKYSG